MKKTKHPTLPKKWLVKLAVATYGKKYFSKSVSLRDNGVLGQLKPPYILLVSHASFADIATVAKLLLPKTCGCYIASDTQFAGKGWILRQVGVMPKKQFSVDASLIRDIKYVLDNGYPLVMYPEAKLSVVGTSNIIKPAVAKLARLVKVPIVTLRIDGSYLHHPRWAKSNRFVPLKATATVVATEEECKTLPTEEIHRRIVEGLDYDDYKYQLDNKISINTPDLVEGLETILYRCPQCGREHTISSHGNTLTCECGTTSQMDEFGRLDGKFNSVVDWYDWQRQCVRNEIDAGKYNVEVRCRAEQQHNRKSFVDVGGALFRHSEKGIEITFDDGKQLFYPSTQFYTLSFNSKYIYLPHSEGVYRFEFSGASGLTTKINIAVEIFGN